MKNVRVVMASAGGWEGTIYGIQPPSRMQKTTRTIRGQHGNRELDVGDLVKVNSVGVGEYMVRWFIPLLLVDEHAIVKAVLIPFKLLELQFEVGRGHDEVRSVLRL